MTNIIIPIERNKAFLLSRSLFIIESLYSFASIVSTVLSLNFCHLNLNMILSVFSIEALALDIF